MSNKASAPKGYGNKTVAELQQACQQLLFQLGQSLYNEAFSQREQSRIQDELEEMEDKLKYAQRAEEAKKIEENNRKVRAENSTTEDTATTLETSDSGESSDQTVSDTGA